MKNFIYTQDRWAYMALLDEGFTDLGTIETCYPPTFMVQNKDNLTIPNECKPFCWESNRMLYGRDG